MATYYKIGTGAWNVTGSWSNSSGGASNGAVPDATTDCIIDASSGNFTVDGTSGTPSLCRSAVFTGYTGTMTMGATAYLKVGDGTAGAFTLVSGMTFTPNAASTIEFASTTTGNNLTFGGKTLGNIIFSGAGGGWTFQDNLAMGAASTMTHTRGAVDTNGKSVTCLNYSSSNTNTRSLTLGATTWTLSSGSNATWDIGTSTNMTLSAASSTITFGATSNPTTFNGGGLTYGTVQQTGLTTGTTTITGSNTFGTLNISKGASPTGELRIEAGSTQTVTGTFTANGNSLVNRHYIGSTVIGTAMTISAATFTFSYLDLQDCTKAGAGSGNISAITGGSGDCGGNTGWTFTTPANQYWVPSAGTSTGSMSAVTRWASSSGGTAGTGRAPLVQDTAYFDANSIDAGSRTITCDLQRMGAVDWTGVTNTPAFAKTATTKVYGHLTLVNGMTQSGTSTWTFRHSSGTVNFTAGSTTFTNPIINNTGGTTMQLDNLTTSNSFTNTTGTWSSNGFTTSVTTYAVSAGATSHTGALSTSGTFTLSGGTFTTTANATFGGALTMSGGTFTFGANSVSITGSQTWQNGTISGTGTITSTTGVVFSGAGTTLNALDCTFACTTITINGSGSTYNIKTINGTGSITATTGTLNHTGTITANTNCQIVPTGGGSGGVAKMAGEGGGFVG